MTQEATYDAAGRVKNMTTADGTILKYEFDDAGRPKKLLKRETASYVDIAELTRNVAGRVIGRDSDKAHRTWTYDRLGRVTQTEVHKNSNKWRFEESMDYFDSNDVKTHLVKRRGLPDSGFSYTYDSRHQLRTANDGSYIADFTYTSGGKVDTAEVDPLALAPQVFGRNVKHNYGLHTGVGAVDGHAVEVLTNTSDNSTYAAYSYDLSGNVIQRDEYMTGSLVQQNFTYDGEDHMRRAKLLGGNEELYYYDENGQRFLSVEVGSKSVVRSRAWFGSTEFWYSGVGNGSDPALEVPGTSYEKLMTRLSLDGLAVARIDNELGQETLEYSFHNGLGHLMGALDTNGEVSTAFVYGPFGEIIDELGETATHLRRFNGKDADPLSRLNYYGYRYYDPLSLQWTQPDPLFRRVPDLAGANPRDMNLYTFSLNNPVRYVDPNGLQSTATIYDGSPEIDTECPPGLGDCGYKPAEITDVSGGGGYDSDKLNEEGNALINKASAGASLAWYGGSGRPRGVSIRSQHTVIGAVEGLQSGENTYKAVAEIGKECGPACAFAWVGMNVLVAAPVLIAPVLRSASAWVPPTLTVGPQGQMLGQAIKLLKNMPVARRVEAMAGFAKQIEVAHAGAWAATQGPIVGGGTLFLGTQGRFLAISATGRLFLGGLMDGAVSFVSGGSAQVAYQLLKEVK